MKSSSLVSTASVLNTLWLHNTVHFRLRSVTEHHAITWGDVSLHTDDETGAQWLEYNERQTKTRTRENPRDIRKVKPKMWATPENPEICPVEIYKRMISGLNASLLESIR